MRFAASIRIVLFGFCFWAASAAHVSARISNDPREQMIEDPSRLNGHAQSEEAAVDAVMPAESDPKINRIINLYDAFGEQSSLSFDWGFSALIEYAGLTILFDGGNNPNILARNTKALGVDLTRVDFAVLSHRHADHASGLDYLLSIKPSTPLYLPHDSRLGAAFDLFLMEVPADLSKSLSPRQKYFGKDSVTIPYDPGDRFWDASAEFVPTSRDIAPGVALIATRNDSLGMNELSLALTTEDGVVIVTGCSHSGLYTIIEETKAYTGLKVHLVIGGYHQAWEPADRVAEIARLMKEELGVARVAPAHCSGHNAFSIFERLYEDDYLFFGLGSVIRLPDSVVPPATAEERHEGPSSVIED